MLTVLATTLALASATTLPATDITATSATLNGEVAGATTAHFEYGTSTTPYGAATPDQPVTDGLVSAPTVTPLTPNTTYHFRIVTDAGVGDDLTFKTLPNPSPPRVTDQRAQDITADEATVSGLVDPNGAQTTYYFQYGRTTSYGRRTERLDAATAARVSARLSGLAPYTRYHWRLVATNSVGVTRGADRTFRTARLATALTLFSSRKVVPYNRGVMLGGRVSGAGVRGMTLALEEQRFPFDRPFAEVGTTHAGEDGGYLFSVDRVRTATRYRVVSRTQEPVTSAVALVRARPRTTIGARLVSRKRARVTGTIKPAIIGELSLQRFTPSGWKQVRHRAITSATTFAFKVTRAKKVTRAFRVVVLPVRGAYVKAKSRSVLVSRRPGRARGRRAAAG